MSCGGLGAGGSHQHAVVLVLLTREESEHGSEVGVVEARVETLTHLLPQRVLVVIVTAQRHGNHVQVQTAAAWQNTSFTYTCSTHI